MKQTVLLVLSVACTLGIFAQGGVHFSQFNNTPLHFNPAATGVFFGGLRVTSSWRNQWAFTGSPFTTIGFTADAAIFNDLTDNDYFAVGIVANSDQLGSGVAVSNRAYGTFAYGRAIDPYENHYFSLGFQGGYVMHTAGFNTFTWENQWETTGFNPALPSREPQPFDAFNYLDFAAGLHYHYNNYSNLKLYGGFAMHHISRPIINYYGDLDQMSRRFNAHGGADITGANGVASVHPAFMFSIQGQNRLFVFGSEFQARLQEASQTVGRIKEVNFALGPYVRWGDGAFIVTRLEWGGFSAGVSYDFNLSRFFQASNGLGGPEIMLRYVAKPFKNYSMKRAKNRFE